MNGGVVMVGLHHRVASMARLEALRRAVEESSPAAAVALGARGAVGVVTCHRVELYLEGVSVESAPALFDAWCPGSAAAAPVVLGGAEAARHLLRVAAGLEAAVLGDDQVLGQLRAAYAAACGGLHAGPLLHRLFHTAFRAGKRVRAETDLGRGGRSVAGEAVALVARRLGGLAGRTVLVLGAGEMAWIAAKRLARRGAGRLLIANRSRQRAQELAAAVGGEVVPWPWRVRAAAGADAVVVGTGAPEPVLTVEELRRAAGSGRGMLAVDLSMPRNLPVPEGPVRGLELVDLERLGTLLRGDLVRRRAAVERAGAIVEEELERWLSWVRNRTSRRAAAGRRGGVAAG